MTVTTEYEGAELFVAYDEDEPEIIAWYLRRADGLARYVGSHGPEGMLSPAQGLVDGIYPFPEHVGLATVVDH